MTTVNYSPGMCGATVRFNRGNMSDPDPEFTPTQRGAFILWLIKNERLTTDEIARRVGRKPRAVRRLLALISEATPIYKERMNGRWVWMILE